jgi:chaperonin GroEL
MNSKEIYFKDQLGKLYYGIELLHDAVASTMGPNGKTVIITDEYGKPYITKDGVSVARKVNFKDHVMNIGAQLIKEVCELQVDLAGDGTTTAVVLAQAFIKNLRNFDSNEINEAFELLIPKVIEQLKLNSRELKNEDIKYVASISANNDVQIGDLIQQAYNHASIVKVEEGSDTKDILELIEGMSLPVSYFSKHFVNNKRKAECDFKEPHILLLDGKLEDLKPFESLLNTMAETNEPLLIVTEHISENVLRLLETNVLSDAIKLCAIKAPGFSQHRKDLLRDLSDFTGAELISDFTKKYTVSVLGKLKSVKVTKNNSLLVKHDSVEINDLIDDLKALSKSKELTSGDKDLVNQRIENLTGKVSIIKVGGNSDLEMKERFDRYDDAVRAVSCALEEGIVEGGGIALSYSLELDVISEMINKGVNNEIASKIVESLSEPKYQIQKNGLILDDRLDMFKQNIIDPLKVTRCALENAVSIAKTILSTNAIVLNERQWEY